MAPKRAPNGQGTIYQHNASGRWCAELHLGIEEGTGKRQVWRKWAARQSDLVEPLAQAIKEKKKLARQAARTNPEECFAAVAYAVVANYRAPIR